MKLLQNPKNIFPEEALVWLSNEAHNIYRARFNHDDPTSAPVITRASAAFELAPMSLLHPFTEMESTSQNDWSRSLIHPTGPAPNDTHATNQPSDIMLPNSTILASGAKELMVQGNGPYGMEHYVNSYSKYMIKRTKYKLEFENYEDFPIIVGYEILPRAVIHSVDNAGVIDSTSMVEFGAEAYADLATLTLNQLKARENVVMGMVPAGQGTVRIAGTASAGASSDANSLHVNPGRAVIDIDVDCLRILKDMARAARPGLNFPDLDISQYIGDYLINDGASPAVPQVTDCPAITGASAQFPFYVQVFVCAPNVDYEDFQGTATDTANHHFTGLHHEGWGTACKNWTAKVNIKPMCMQEVLLLDPIVPVVKDLDPLTAAQYTQAS